MLDLVRLYVKAGDGGDGKVAFFRNRQVLKGGPEGGDGGDGGDVILEADEKLNTLQHLSGVKSIVARDGEMGGRGNRTGNKGDKVIVKVPLGTVVWLYDENQVSIKKRLQYGLKKKSIRDDEENEKYVVEKETNPPAKRVRDEIDKNQKPRFEEYVHNKVEVEDGEYAQNKSGNLLKIATLDKIGSKIILCHGGRGGRGNNAFKRADKTTPLEAEYGSYGEQKMVFLELRLLANVGLVGWPNAGKSTFLSRITKAKPKIANYPFTTLEPNLGVMNLTDNRSLVVADIPGLIEGASMGKGLGYAFLRHVQNCNEIIYTLFLSEEQVCAENINNAENANNLYNQYLQLYEEILDYNELLTHKSALILINKSDLYSDELKSLVRELFMKNGLEVWFVSSVTGEGIEEIKERIWTKYVESGL